jgi:ribosomal protein S3AE
MAVSKSKKKWYNVVAPIFRGAVIGETLGYDQNDLKNRNLDLNFMSITNDPKTQNIRVLFKINDVKDNNAIVEVIGYELTLSYVKRVIRKDANKIADSYEYKTKDNVKVVVKPLVITRYKTNKSVLQSLRKNIRAFLEEEIKKNNFNDFINLIVYNKVQKALREKLKKIYPISACEFRIVKKV